MKTQSDYVPQNDFGLLLVGPPLSGKTTVAMQFPDVYVISTDHKLKNAIQRLPAGKKWWYDYVDVDDFGRSVPYHEQWARATTLLKNACVDPQIRTIVWDNLTDLSGMLQAHIIANGGSKLVVGGEKVMEQTHWQPFKLLLQRSIALARGSGKVFIVCCHEVIDKDEISGMMVYRPLVPGQLRDHLGGFFTDVWRCETDVVPGKPIRYFVRTVPTPRMSLGRSVAGLPDEFVFDWDTFSKLLNPTPV